MSARIRALTRPQFLRGAAGVVLAALGLPAAAAAARNAPSTLPAAAPVGLPPGYIEACAAPYKHYPGWLPCDGRVIDPNEYPALAAVLGDTYGRTYRLPDLRGLGTGHEWSWSWAIKT